MAVLIRIGEKVRQLIDEHIRATGVDPKIPPIDLLAVNFKLLFEYRDGIEENRKEQAMNLGLSETEFAFHNILMAEIIRITGNEAIDEATHKEVIRVTKELVDMLDDATEIVDFFNKQDEIKAVQHKIKRELVEASFDDEDLRKAVMERFMELAKVKIGK